MKNIYLVNYQAVYWDVNKSPLIIQKEISFPTIETYGLSDGELIIALQNKIERECNYYKQVIVLNFWKKGFTWK